jgi:hypothetical protein
MIMTDVQLYFAIGPLRANIDETFLTAQNREQGEKEMNHRYWHEGKRDGSLVENVRFPDLSFHFRFSRDPRDR